MACDTHTRHPLRPLPHTRSEYTHAPRLQHVTLPGRGTESQLLLRLHTSPDLIDLDPLYAERNSCEGLEHACLPGLSPTSKPGTGGMHFTLSRTNQVLGGGHAHTLLPGTRNANWAPRTHTHSPGRSPHFLVANTSNISSVASS